MKEHVRKTLKDITHVQPSRRKEKGKKKNGNHETARVGRRKLRKKRWKPQKMNGERSGSVNKDDMWETRIEPV